MASWLLGQPVPLTQLDPKELLVEPIRADSVILLQSEQMILHIEFQTEPYAAIPFRMADYYLHLYYSKATLASSVWRRDTAV